MVKVHFDFRERLIKKLGAENFTYCFQCGACVGDCPSARYTEDFNPRTIILEALFGMTEELLKEDSPIWQCTNCYNCYERCPQDVRPVEVIVALKNIVREEGMAPGIVGELVKSVKETGRTVRITALSDKRRIELGLEPISKDKASVEELRKILE
jgi:heterodisulfide reductase subunit C